jgi:hypothetical protein
MNSNSLSKAQARQMHAALAPTLRYLNRLNERLNARSFSPDDRLYRAAGKAQAAMSELVMVLHCLTCDGVGEPARSAAAQTTETAAADERGARGSGGGGRQNGQGCVLTDAQGKVKRRHVIRVNEKARQGCTLPGCIVGCRHDAISCPAVPRESPRSERGAICRHEHNAPLRRSAPRRRSGALVASHAAHSSRRHEQARSSGRMQ